MLRVLLIVGLVVVGLPAMMYLLWVIHCTLDRVCVRHARRFCKRHGLEISRVRWQIEFEQRSDGTRGVKTEFTLVQLDCFDFVTSLAAWSPQAGQRRDLSREL